MARYIIQNKVYDTEKNDACGYCPQVVQISELVFPSGIW